MYEIELETLQMQQQYWIQMRENAELENLILRARLRKMKEDEQN